MTFYTTSRSKWDNCHWMLEVNANFMWLLHSFYHMQTGCWVYSITCNLFIMSYNWIQPPNCKTTNLTDWLICILHHHRANTICCSTPMMLQKSRMRHFSFLAFIKLKNFIQKKYLYPMAEPTIWQNFSKFNLILLVNMYSGVLQLVCMTRLHSQTQN
jgi:hypothetical protein